MIKLNLKQRIYQLLFTSFAVFCAVGFGFVFQASVPQLNAYNPLTQDQILIGADDGQYDNIDSDQIWRSKSNKNEFFIIVADQELMVTFSSLHTTTGQNSDTLLKGISVKLTKISAGSGSDLNVYYKIIRRIDNNVIQYRILVDSTNQNHNLDIPANLNSRTIYLTDIIDSAASSQIDWITPNWTSDPEELAFNSVFKAMLEGVDFRGTKNRFVQNDRIATIDVQELFALIELRFAELDIAEWISFGNQLIDYKSGKFGLGLMFDGVNGANDYFQIIHQFIDGKPNYKIINALEGNYESRYFDSDSSTPPTAAGTFTGLDVMDENDVFVDEKLDFSILYDFLELIFELDNDIGDRKYTTNPFIMNIFFLDEPRFEIDFISSQNEIVTNPLFVFVKTLSRQISSIPLQEWNQYFSLSSQDTVESTKNELIEVFMNILFDSSSGNDFSFADSSAGVFTNVEGEIIKINTISLALQNQFHITEIMNLISLVYKYLILSIDETVSPTDDLDLVTERLFVRSNFIAVNSALQDLAAGFFAEFHSQHGELFEEIIGSMLGYATLISGDNTERVNEKIETMTFQIETIDWLLNLIKIMPTYWQGIYAIFSNEVPGSQLKKTIDLLNVPNESPVIRLQLHEFFTSFATKFFQWDYDVIAANTKAKLRSLFKLTLDGDISTATKQHSKVLYNELNERFQILNAILADGWMLNQIIKTDGYQRATYTKNFINPIPITDLNSDEEHDLNSVEEQITATLEYEFSGGPAGQIYVYYTHQSDGRTVIISQSEGDFEDFTTIEAINQNIRLKLIKQAIKEDNWTLDETGSTDLDGDDYEIYTKDFVDPGSFSAFNPDGTIVSAKLKLMLSGDLAERVSSYFTIKGKTYIASALAEYYHQEATSDSELFEPFYSITKTNRKINFKLIERTFTESGWVFFDQVHRERRYIQTIEGIAFKIIIYRAPSDCFGQYEITSPDIRLGEFNCDEGTGVEFISLSNIDFLTNGRLLIVTAEAKADAAAYIEIEALKAKLEADSWIEIDGNSETQNQIFYTKSFSPIIEPDMNFFIAIVKTGFDGGEFELYTTSDGLFDEDINNASNPSTKISIIEAIFRTNNNPDIDNLISASAYGAVEVATIINVYLNDLYLTADGWEGLPDISAGHIKYTKSYNDYEYVLKLELAGNNINEFKIYEVDESFESLITRKFGSDLTTVESTINNSIAKKVAKKKTKLTVKKTEKNMLPTIVIAILGLVVVLAIVAKLMTRFMAPAKNSNSKK